MVRIAKNDPPTEEVISLRNQGKSDNEIVSMLSRKGFNNQQISEAINQADIKGGVEGSPTPATGAPVGMQPSMLGSEDYENSESEIPVPVPSPKGEKTKPHPIQSPRMPQIQPPQVYPQQSQMDIESVQEIVESIIDERWQEVVASVGDIALWKSKVEDDLSAVKQEVLRLEDRFAKLQASMIGKVDEYQKGISKVSTDMVALEKVFSKIMEPLTSNIKELQDITQSMKKKKS